jgi:hypothetical protein
MMGASSLTDTIQIPINGMIIIVLTSLITVGVYLLIFRLGWGKRARAVISNRAMLSAVGIDTERGGSFYFWVGLRHSRGGRQCVHHDCLNQPDCTPAASTALPICGRCSAGISD